METDPHSRALFNISFGVPSKGALPPGPPHGLSSKRDAPFLELSVIQISQHTTPPPIPDSRFPSEVKGPLCREMPVSGAFLKTSSRVPNNGALRSEPLQRETPDS